MVKLSSKYSKISQIGESLLSPEGKYLGFPFEIGDDSSKLIIYGSPATIKSRTTLLDALPLEELTKIPRLATIYEITSVNLPGFMIVWMYLNGLFEDHVDYNPFTGSEYTILDYLIALEWYDYFGLTQFTHFYEYLTDQANYTTLFDNKHLNDTRELVISRLSMDKFVPKSAILSTLTPGEYKQFDQGVPNYLSEDQIHWWFNNIPKPLSDIQKEWSKSLNIHIDDQVKSSDTGLPSLLS